MNLMSCHIMNYDIKFNLVVVALMLKLVFLVFHKAKGAIL